MNIVILTGAGISAESGLGTFRDTDGLWTRYRIEDVATPDAYARNPALVHEFYNLRRHGLRAAVPNAAHFALADLERRHSGGFLLVTQNVDDLHQRAGSQNVLAMHGQLQNALCAGCGHVWPAPDLMFPEDRCACCDAPLCRPDLVWFGEDVRFLDQIIAATEKADLFALIGTSGNVHPAAGLMELARECGAATVEINLEPSAVASAADRVILGRATEMVPRWVADILSGQSGGSHRMAGPSE
jgi:NAD-dependent deacetylase